MTEPRAVLLACDDYSAVSGKVPLWQLYERGRSLGIGVQVSAQSWHGLGATDDERYRIAATADGGIWLMRTPHPEPVAQLAGTRRVVETATKITAGTWGDEGSSRIQHAFVADPGIARRLATGQAGYIHAGGCTWVHIARPRPSPVPVPVRRPRPSPGPVLGADQLGGLLPASRRPGEHVRRGTAAPPMTTLEPETATDAPKQPSPGSVAACFQSCPVLVSMSASPVPQAGPLIVRTMVVADTALREELADQIAAPLKPFSALDLQTVALILN